MLTRFRSVLSVPKVHLFLMFFACVLAVLLSVSMDESWARMEDPVPAPHLEGWPEPHDDHVTSDSETSLIQAKSSGPGSSAGIPRSDPDEQPALKAKAPMIPMFWVVRVLYRSHLLP
jgi:hypothetical protein